MGSVPREPAYVGVDVAFAKRKHLPVCVCVRRDDRLTPLPLRGGSVAPPRGSGNSATLDRTVVRRFARDAARYIEAVARDHHLDIVRIAIDAPRDYRGGDTSRRSAELAMDDAGISCYATPSKQDFARIKRKVRAHLAEGGSEGRLPHANQLWMLVGFGLFEGLPKVAECIEVFPQATVQAIGAGQKHKFKKEGLAAQVAAAARFTGWTSLAKFESSLATSAYGPGHDRLDAYLSAWVASLDEPNRVALGTKPDDVIWIPRISTPDAVQVTQANRAPAPSAAQQDLPLKELGVEAAPQDFPLSTRFDEALRLTASLHRGQYRKDTKIPYLAHLLGVASLALQYGATEDEAIAALLHDAVEDQGGESTADLIAKKFGQNVADIVIACSDPPDVEPTPPWRERKVAYLKRLRDASPSVRFVSACDKLDKLRAILTDYKKDGERVWTRLSGERDETFWYFRSLIRELGREPSSSPAVVLALREMLNELERVVGLGSGDE